MRGDLRLRRREQTFGALGAIAVGMLAAGLVVPYAVGDSVTTENVAAADLPQPEGGEEAAPVEPASPDETTTGPVTSTVPGPDMTSGDTDSAAGRTRTAATPSPGQAPLGATDRGVTPTTIRVGFALLDLGGASAVGLAVAGYSIEEQKRAYQVFVDDVNGRGGINGRKIEAYYRSSDPLQRDSAQALCHGFAQDDKVFAVLAQPGFRGHLCVTEQEQMLLMLDFAASDIFERSGGRLITNQQTGNRMMFDWIGELDRMNVLRGKKIGVLGDEDTANGDKQAVETGVLPALKQLGYTVTYRSRLSANLNTGASQIPVEVSQMRRAGVDAVLIATNFVYATQFVQTADSQRWFPAYFTSDHNGMSSDDLTENMPSSFDGAIGLTVSRAPTREAREGLPEAEPERNCREFYNAAAEDDIAYGDTSPVPYSCGQVHLFAATATTAGPELTRETFSAALQEEREFVMPGLFGGAFGPGKFDYADVARPLRWHASCECWRYAGPPRRVRF